MENSAESPQEFPINWSPDLAEVSSLIIDTWHRPCWNYDQDLLKLHIQRPSAGNGIVAGHTSPSGKLISYFAHVPFDIEYLGNRYRSLFGSFLTVSKDFQGRGLAGKLKRAMIARAIEMGYEAYIEMYEVGEISDSSVTNPLLSFGRKGGKLKVFGYLAAHADLLKPILPATASPRTRTMTTGDIPEVARLIASAGVETGLRKVINPTDLDFVFLTRPHSVTYVYESDDKVRGVANILLLEVLNGGKSLNAYFENVHFGDLNDAEQQEFISDCLVKLMESKFRVAFVPDIGYTNISTFRKLRFRATPRQLNLFMAPLAPDALDDWAKPVQSFYLDVF